MAQFPDSGRSASPRFDSTRWSIVLAAGLQSSPDAAVAFEQLCASYWYPLYAFVRREGYQQAEAQDLTQGFFASLLQRHDLQRVHPDKGRFRSFLLAALKNYLLNEWDRARAQKRGGGRPLFSLDFDLAESKLGSEQAGTTTPEFVFQRQWALTLLAYVQEQLKSDMSAKGRGDLYDALLPHLAGEPGAAKYTELADLLGMTEAAVKMAMSRLRKRYRALLREEIAQTVSGEAEIDDEIRDLFDALRRPNA
ncbi:MAG: sigma-70 family RNA polymerase sigma factor [Fuerstiella sp.]|jgi:RNA polymerase sigma-70 factor (ECF subfamily)|nr:sigma-70 family RNA polymerase sigma factor [Fuerstiella sp.]MCP4512222.1 sigma-70 family RNA polymerase sigma factor [Fuerstiella sp.]MDG2128061.1 ECF-type sigma factor [Fuerstiella sp.]